MLANHTADFVTCFKQVLALFGSKVATIQGHFKPVLCFLIFGVCIGQFADEVHFITAFCPGFGDLCANSTGRTAHLVGEGIHFFARKDSCNFKDILRQLPCFLVNEQLSKCRYAPQLTHLAFPSNVSPNTEHCPTEHCFTQSSSSVPQTPHPASQTSSPAEGTACR